MTISRATMFAVGIGMILAACGGSTDESQVVPAANNPAPPPETTAGTFALAPQNPEPGETFTATFSADHSRGGYFVLSSWDGEDWNDPAFLLESDANQASPTVTEVSDGWGVDDYGVNGTGPDGLVMPDEIDDGYWRLCTANALVDICTQFVVGSETQPGEPSATGQSELSRFTDPSLEDTMYEVSWEVPDDLNGLVASADHIIVGTIVGISEAEFTDGPSEEDPSGTVEEWDGIVFRVEDVLKGGVSAGEVFTVVHPVVLVSPTGETARIAVAPIDELLAGLEALDDGIEGPRYLLFSSKAQDEDFSLLLGPGSVVEVAEDGTVGVASVGALDARRVGGTDLTVEQLKALL